MIPPPRIPFLKDGLAIGAKRHKGFAHAWNWLIHSFWHLTFGPGLRWRDKWGGFPSVELNIRGEGGINVDYREPEYGEPAGYVVISGGGNGIPGPFSPVYTDGVLTGLANCIFCAERQFVDCGDMAVSSIDATSTGYVVLTLTHPSSADTLFADTDAAVTFTTSGAIGSNSDATQTVIPLYHITDGVVDVDLRAVPTAVLAR